MPDTMMRRSRVPSLNPERLVETLAPAADWAYLGVLLALNRLGRTDPAERAEVLADIAEMCAAGAERERARSLDDD